MAGRQVLVTGASGFIASHVTKRLLQAGYRVRATVRNLKDFQKVTPVQLLCPDASFPVELCQTDLSDADCWHKVVDGCEYVMHIASPVPVSRPMDENSVIKPAVDGTMNILQAAMESKTVRRVVFTSCLNAITGDVVKTRSEAFTESDWADISYPLTTAHTKSKYYAERTAWEFVENNPDSFELTVLNPCTVYGPVLCGSYQPSMHRVKSLLQPSRPRIPRNISLKFVDVRDVATAHLVSMVTPEAAGKRYILFTETTSLTEFTEILDKEFYSQGYRVPFVKESMISKFLTWKRKESFTPIPIRIDNQRMTEDLGIKEPYRVYESLLDMAYSMIENGMVHRTSKYQGPARILC